MPFESLTVCDHTVFSFARSHGLGTSILGRMSDQEFYKSSPLELKGTLLTTNYRCHPKLVDLASRLFYEGRLTFVPTHTHRYTHA